MLLWLTDIHLNHLPLPTSANELGKYLRFENPGLTGVVLTGDISEGEDSACRYQLESLAYGLQVPVYYVCGNHDYVGSSWEARAAFRRANPIPHVTYLPDHGPVDFPAFTLVGVDGWYDAAYGNPFTAYRFGEWFEIADLVPGAYYKTLLIAICAEKAKHEASKLAHFLDQVDVSKPIVVLTHVPPYPESALYEGAPSPRESAPWFINGTLGVLLKDFAEGHPDTPVTVLCGHTHSKASFSPLPNLSVFTGEATYGVPDVSGLLDPNTGKLLLT